MKLPRELVQDEVGDARGSQSRWERFLIFSFAILVGDHHRLTRVLLLDGYYS